MKHFSAIYLTNQVKYFAYSKVEKFLDVDPADDSGGTESVKSTKLNNTSLH